MTAVRDVTVRSFEDSVGYFNDSDVTCIYMYMALPCHTFKFTTQRMSLYDVRPLPHDETGDVMLCDRVGSNCCEDAYAALLICRQCRLS